MNRAMNEKEKLLYEFMDVAFTDESHRKARRKNAEFWRHINALREQSSDKIEVIQGIVKDPFVGKYCTNAEIQCDSLDTKKAAEAILTTYYYRVPLDVEPSIGETCDLYTRLPER
ncbi:MAG TPA: hypothetical protein DER55_11575 [Bacteroides uniformis]|jgi:hypothetical protein|nr:MAG TPA: hypothetical protein [Caudoviricetes sp.]HCF77432.1 hypothetical protein [Bacteroides uniformis]